MLCRPVSHAMATLQALACVTKAALRPRNKHGLKAEGARPRLPQLQCDITCPVDAAARLSAGAGIQRHLAHCLHGGKSQWPSTVKHSQIQPAQDKPA